jgi:hypothetical protein
MFEKTEWANSSIISLYDGQTVPVQWIWQNPHNLYKILML